MTGIVGPDIPDGTDLGDVMFHHPDIKMFEVPTQQAMWEWCKGNPDAAIIYCHTKGVSKPRNWHRTVWRMIMELCVVERWRENVELLNEHDAVGFNWYLNPDWKFCTLPRFVGTFFMARADWINKLPSPLEFSCLDLPPGARPANRRQARRFRKAWRRNSSEHWISSAPGIRVVGLGKCGLDIYKKQRWMPLLQSMRSSGVVEQTEFLPQDKKT